MDKVQKHNSFNTKYTIIRILQKQNIELELW
jgi:hypothetical protein